MIWCTWAAKGGSGCSVVAAAAALLSARRRQVLLVDLAGGDQARILGVEPEGPGLTRWLRHPNPPPDSLARLEVPVAADIALLPFRGSDLAADVSTGSPPDDVDLGERWVLLAHLLAADERLVVVDLGLGLVPWAASHAGPDPVSASVAIAGVAERCTLVTRLCYLALARAMEQPVPDDVIVVAEPDRALRVADVEAALRVPVAAIRCDPAVARAVDAGLLTRRLPRALRRIPLAVAGAADPRTSAPSRVELQ